MFRPLVTLVSLSASIILASCDGMAGKHVDIGPNQTVRPALTAAIIDSLEDLDLLFAVSDDLAVRQGEDYEQEYDIVRSWNASRQAIYMIWELEAQVNNGGHNQFYYNPSGQFHELLPDALRLVGAVKHAELMERANGIYKRENRKITEHLDGTLEGFSKSYDDNPLNPLDDEFYEMEGESLLELQASYIRANKEDFIGN